MEANGAVLLFPHLCIKVTQVGLHLSPVFRIGPIKKSQPLPATAPKSDDTRIQDTLCHPQPILTFSTLAKMSLPRWGWEHTPSKICLIKS